MAEAQVRHTKDQFGNDIWIPDCDVHIPVLPHITDYKQQLQDVKNMQLRPDDVIVDCFPKSGNNWLHHIVTFLLAGTTVPPTAEQISDEEFWFLDSCGGGKKLPAPVRPRALMSHLPFRYLPRDVVDKKVKVVHCFRNPKDVFVSWYCHLQMVKPPLGYDGTWPQFFQVMLQGGFPYGDVFEHMRDWENETDDHPEQPILHVTYEDMKQDSLGQIQRINDFLGTNRDRQLCEEIAETCRFSNMAATRVFSEDALRTFLLREDRQQSDFWRKGVVGDWKNWFTVAQNEEFEEVYNTKMAGSKLTFRFQ